MKPCNPRLPTSPDAHAGHDPAFASMIDSASSRPLPVRALNGLLAGAAAGLVALAVDYLLAYLFIGSPLPWAHPEHGLYPAVGAAFGLVAGLIRLRGPFFWAWLGIYLLPTAERLADAAAVRTGSTTLGQAVSPVFWIGGLLVGGAGFAVAVALISKRFGDQPSGRLHALALVALTVAAGLSLNRHLVDRPLSQEALILDSLVVLITLAATELWRRRGLPIVLATAAVLLLVAAGLTERRIHQLPADLPNPADATADGSTPPHLILLVVDTLRADVLQSVVETTPEGRTFYEHFKDAAWFDRTQAAAPWTAPSMASILTGLYPSEHGFGVLTAERDPNRTLRPLVGSLPTLASRLAQRGYLTEALLANPILFSGSGIDRGFQRYEILDGSSKKMPLLSVFTQLHLLKVNAYQNAEQVNRRLARHLDRLEKVERPLFLWLQYLDPHEPIMAHPDLPPDPVGAELDEEQRLYRDEVRYTLKHLDHTVTMLRQAGIWDDAVVVFVSDHGEMMHADGHRTPVLAQDGKFLRHGHGKALYNGVTRVPLMIRPPGGLEQEVRVGDLVSHIDLHDTVVDLLGVDVPPIGRDRVSLAPYLRGETPPNRRPWALLGGIQAGIPQKGLVTEHHKLIVYDRTKPPELYRLDRDPGETENLTRYPNFDWTRFPRRLDTLWGTLSEREDDVDADIDAETRGRLEALGYL